jgi:hypothetical protein
MSRKLKIYVDTTEKCLLLCLNKAEKLLRREEKMVKIKEYRITKRGARGIVLSMPKVWV